MSATRGQKLDESLTYQQFLAKVEEEEAWISEKQQLLSVEDFGDNMAAVQGLLKKHDAFETDFAVHRDRCSDICEAGNQLITEGNHHSTSVGQRCQQLQVCSITIPFLFIQLIIIIRAIFFFYFILTKSPFFVKTVSF